MRSWWVRDASGRMQGPLPAWEIDRAVRSGAWAPHIEVSLNQAYWAAPTVHPEFAADAAAAPGAVSPMRARVGGAVLGGLLALGSLAKLISFATQGPPPRAQVHCRGDAAVGIRCEVQHLAGPSLNVCWDAVIVCQNGQRVVGHGCEDLARAGSTTHIIPEAALSNLSACDRGLRMELQNMVVTRR